MLTTLSSIAVNYIKAYSTPTSVMAQPADRLPAAAPYTLLRLRRGC